MIGGVYYVLTGVWSWVVILASLPIGLNVVTINLGKHTDKLREDKGKGVRTLPVLVGEPAARNITMGAIILSYLIVLYLIFVTHFFTPILLLIFMAIKPAQVAIKRLSKPRPTEPPPGYPIWPRWFSTVCFVHNRVFSNYFVLALIIETVVRTVSPNFWR
jgi:1,4-dihydroxy-2-naphthoate octaprenyltransferase